MCRPLFLDHFQKVAVIYYTLEDRSEGNSIVPTESCRETNNRNLVWEFVYDQTIGMLYVIVESGQYTAIPKEVKCERVYFFWNQWECILTMGLQHGELRR